MLTSVPVSPVLAESFSPCSVGSPAFFFFLNRETHLGRLSLSVHHLPKRNKVIQSDRLVGPSNADTAKSRHCHSIKLRGRQCGTGGARRCATRGARRADSPDSAGCFYRALLSRHLNPRLDLWSLAVKLSTNKSDLPPKTKPAPASGVAGSGRLDDESFVFSSSPTRSPSCFLSYRASHTAQASLEFTIAELASSWSTVPSL